jgi:putative colanic acid biosynthesis UDP-glucose lipid carrier transferase
MRVSDRVFVCFLIVMCDLGAFFATYQLIDFFENTYHILGPHYFDTHNKWLNGSIWVVIAIYLRVYQSYVNHSFDIMLRQTWRALVYQQIVVASILYVNTGRFVLEQVILVKIGLLCFFIFSIRYLIIWLDFKIENGSNHLNRIGIFGLNQSSIRLAKEFEWKFHGNKFVGIINELDVLRFGYDPVHPTEQILNALHYAKQDNIRELYVCFPSHLIPDMDYLFLEAEKLFIRLHIVPSAIEKRPYEYQSLSDLGISIFSNRKNPLDNYTNRLMKRTFDVLFSLLVIVFIISWLFPIIAILIKWQSPGPILFKQKRSGRSNQVFWCYKFRSMHVNQQQDSKQAEKNDTRLTPVGRFIRKTSLDEFPQFWNVLKGEMSVIGPRPHMLYHTNHYQKLADGFSYRHFVKPGITGLAQVSGFRGEITGVDVLQGRIEKDIEYIENWSLVYDLKICFLTVYFLFVGDEHAF